MKKREEFIRHIGDWTGTISDLCRLTGICRHTAYQRITKYTLGEWTAAEVFKPKYEGRGKSGNPPKHCNSTPEWKSYSMRVRNENLTLIPVGEFDNI